MDDQSHHTAERLNALVARLRAEYASDPNVKHVSWGVPRRKGELRRETAIIFRVREKLRTEEQMASVGTKALPASIEGFPTDVQVQESVRASDLLDTRDALADPLNGGWLTGTYSGHTFWWGSTGGGSLGVLCSDNASGDTMALSNWHVWADGFEEGDNILQPSSPTAGGYVEGTVKVAACGPLVTSLIEWEWPDPLTAALYGGAAAAAVAAALSDHRDPTRRGQDATPTAPDERTLSESVTAKVEYPDLPCSGTPFRADVDWKYARVTDRQTHTHVVEETLVNPQFLFGKRISTDRPAYTAGNAVTIRAAIWDYQPRPCDGYFVVAHVIADGQPHHAHRVVLHPEPCERGTDDQPDRKCLDFGAYKSAQSLGPLHIFEWLIARSLDSLPLRIVEWSVGGGGRTGTLQIRERGVLLAHAPASMVVAQIVRFNNRPVVLTAYDAAGNVVGGVSSSGSQGQPETLTVNAELIARTVVNGGGNEAYLLQYCTVDVRAAEPVMVVPAHIAEGLERGQVPTMPGGASTRLRTRRCCFAGTLRLPPHADLGTWKVYVFVQNVNHVPEGTKPEVAATIIGGHMLSAGLPYVVACGGIMLFDHVFDVI